MANIAVNLLKPVLWNGTLTEYQKAVHKKVRFYNIRSKYLYENRLIIESFEKKKNDFKKHLDSLKNKERREFIKENFKGFGMKESSHFLRNIGFKGYTIIDKHILNMMTELNVLKTNKPPKNKEEYYEIEQKIKKFANKEKYNIDELDLALWSYKTGKVIK
ncbi:hypothetical protein K9K83_04760 [Candidatus Woesearchaeota archaeon]|nr:hypothetical protein [Candidatus Woesearchaeota archaeon]